MKRRSFPKRYHSRSTLLASLFVVFVMEASFLQAQPTSTVKPASTAQPKQAASQFDEAETIQVIIKKDAVHLIPPEKFQAPISLQPIQLLEIRAKVSGVVKNVRVKLGGSVRAQEELIQIESERARMNLDYAKATLKAATLKKELVAREVSAGKQAQVALDLAEAEIDVAKARLDLAQLDIKNTSVRAVFSGQIKEIKTTPGAIINKGDLLLVLVDTTKLLARIPVNREEVKMGETIEVKLDNQVARAKVQSMLPLEGKWQPLRQILDTAAIAVVEFDNRDGNLKDGQTAYSPIVPRQPVIEVPNLSLRNSEKGSRIIQVVRDSMVRDIEVQLLGPIGEDRSYVTGPIQAGDELIAESSQSLADGALIRPATVVANPKTKKRTTPPGQPAQTREATPF